MGAVYFYHLTHSPLEVALPLLLERALQAGWRVAVRGASAQGIERLDQALWLGRDEAFLPHGVAGGAHDAHQPVLLTTGALPEGCACLMAVDGATLAPDEVAGVERACLLFDGNDNAALEAARGQWKALTAAGLAAQYWAEDGGRWQKKAESVATV